MQPECVSVVINELRTQNSEICLFNPLFYKEIIHVYKTLKILKMGQGDIC